jgi:hypothetical protein
VGSCLDLKILRSISNNKKAGMRVETANSNPEKEALAVVCELTARGEETRKKNPRGRF